MKKRILLSLLLTGSTFVHAMKNEPSFLDSFLSWFSSNQTPNESKLIKALRKSKNKFNEELGDIYCINYNGYKPDPREFLGYCYCHSIKDDIGFCPLRTLRALNLNPSMLEKYHEVRCNGYSALGATMMAEDTSIKEKHTLIQKLITRYAFKLTLKDIGLAELILYDAITEHHKTFLHLLHAHSSIHWSALPQEVRTQIAQHMIRLFKNEFWLLPEKH